MKKIYYAMIIMGTVIMLSGCKKDDYQEAMNSYEGGHYEQAIEQFRQLGDYEKSEYMIEECYFELGVTSLKNKEYLQALEWFGYVPKHAEVNEQIELCYTEYVKQQVLEGKYEAAKEYVNGITKESIDRIALINYCDYNQAVALYNEKKYKKAKNLFEKVGDYEEAKKYIKECKIKIQEAAEYFLIEYVVNDSEEEDNNTYYARGNGLLKFNSDIPLDDWVGFDGRYVTYTNPGSSVHFRYSNKGKKTLKNAWMKILFDGVFLRDTYGAFMREEHIHGIGGWAGGSVYLGDIQAGITEDIYFEMPEAYFVDGKNAVMQITVSADNYKAITYKVKCKLK